MARIALDQCKFATKSKRDGARELRAVSKRLGGRWEVRRITAQRIWKIVKALGRRSGMPNLHPPAFRHGCGVELLKRSGGNLRAVQEHLRHADIQTTTIYTRLTQTDLQKIVSTFDAAGS